MAFNFEPLSNILLYILLIIFIVFRYKTKALLDEDRDIKPDIIVIIIGIIYSFIVLINAYYLQQSPVLIVLLILSTAIIIFSVIRNVRSSPILEEFGIGSQNNNQNDNSKNAVNSELVNDLKNIDLQEYYNNQLLFKTLVTLFFYIITTTSLWFIIWKKDCNLNNLLCKKEFIFVIIYFAFAIFIMLDMFKNTKTFGFFEYDPNERKNIIFSNDWVLYSFFYTLYLVYILIISQSIKNTINGLSIDKNYAFSTIIASLLIIIHSIHYFRLQKSKEENCECENKNSRLNNNIKLFQINSLILPILIIIVSIIS